MKNNKEKLKDILKDMFQYDRSDLDFGIYRVMNQKREEIERFIERDLFLEIETLLKPLKEDKVEEKIEEIDKQIKVLSDLNDDGSLEPKIEELLREKISCEKETNIGDIESEIYSHINNFFNRYYDEGDFISQRRYKDGVYAIPYEGEEVKLHWANFDQYYVKSSEHFKDYVFEDKEGNKIYFKLLEANTEKDNNKNDKKTFQCITDIDEYNSKLSDGEEKIKANPEIIDGNLVIYFEYKEDNLNQSSTNPGNKNTRNYKNFEYIKQKVEENKWFNYVKLIERENKSSFSELDKQLNRYTAKNTYDFFIHKDLEGFLKRELDFYIKNEVLKLEDIDLENMDRVRLYLNKANIVKEICEIIIKFLAQLEEFQKSLWLKKKFVVDTNYCLTLDRIDESFYKDICSNKKQEEEWIKLYSIEDLEGYKEGLSVDFLKNNQYLMIDTRFFTEDFKESLISSIDNLDKSLDGILINSDNFHALNLLQEKYREKIDCIYIDPPYNTGNDGFLYKDNYKHSSWLTMIDNRKRISDLLLKYEAPFFMSLSSKELYNISSIYKEDIDNIFNIKVRHEERILRKDIKYQDVMEYLILMNKNFKPGRIYKNEDVYKDYIYKIQIKGVPKNKLNIGEYPVEIYSSDSFEIIKTKPNKNNMKRYTIRGSLITQTGSASEYYEMYLRDRREVDGFGTLYKVIGMGERGDGLGYRYIQQPENKKYKNGIYFQGTPINNKNIGNPHPNYFDYVSDFNNCTDEGGIAFKNGKKPLKFMFKIFEILDRTNFVILDYFAGSGTTGHAVINLNREDDGNRKYILVEMGEYFNSVTKPRIQKAVYSKKWKDGKPIDREGISQAFKYFSLESYEDSLNNIIFEDENIYDLFSMNRELQREYIISYMLSKETENSKSLLNIDELKNPFNYRMKIVENYEQKEKKIDLIETFNYLIGLKVYKNYSSRLYDANFDKDEYGRQGVELIDGNKYKIKLIDGYLPNGDRALIIWRNITDDLERDSLVLNKFLLNEVEDIYDVIYVNGDNFIKNLKNFTSTRIEIIEKIMKEKMFEDVNI